MHYRLGQEEPAKRLSAILAAYVTRISEERSRSCASEQPEIQNTQEDDLDYLHSFREVDGILVFVDPQDLLDNENKEWYLLSSGILINSRIPGCDNSRLRMTSCDNLRQLDHPLSGSLWKQLDWSWLGKFSLIRCNKLVKTDMVKREVEIELWGGGCVDEIELSSAELMCLVLLMSLFLALAALSFFPKVPLPHDVDSQELRFQLVGTGENDVYSFGFMEDFTPDVSRIHF
ncbi:hypothetical protein Tco_0152030 [Tanacetum coccineum]